MCDRVLCTYSERDDTSERLVNSYSRSGVLAEADKPHPGDPAFLLNTPINPSLPTEHISAVGPARLNRSGLYDLLSVLKHLLFQQLGHRNRPGGVASNERIADEELPPEAKQRGFAWVSLPDMRLASPIHKLLDLACVRCK